MTRYCRNCGNALAESVAICAVCGVDVDDTDGEDGARSPDPDAASLSGRRRPFEAITERPRPADRRRSG